MKSTLLPQRIIVLVLSLTVSAYTAFGGPFSGWRPFREPLEPAKRAHEDLTKEIKKKTGIPVDKIDPIKKAYPWVEGWKPFREPLLPAERAATEAMDTVDEAQRWATLFLETMLWNRHWPEGYPAQPVRKLSAPSAEIMITQKAISEALGLYKDEVIPLKESDDHLVIGQVDLELDRSRNVYKIKIAGGKLRYAFVRDNSFHVKGATFEAIPFLITTDKDEALQIAFKTRCVHLDVDDCPGEIDRFVAHALNEVLEDRDQGIIGTVNLTELIASPIKMATQSGYEATAKLKDATVFIQNDAIVAQVQATLLKQAPKNKPD